MLLPMLSMLIMDVTAVNNPEEFVNLLAGSFTDGRSFSTGNTLPLVGMPWGFNHWAPQSKEQNARSDSWWFDGNMHEIAWMRCTHQPSPWIGDWGWFLFAPMMGDNMERNPKGFWEPRAAHIKPHVFDATLAPLAMRIELVPTMHAAAMRVTFPNDPSKGARRICFRELSFDHTDRNSNVIKGRSGRVSIDRMMVSNFNMFMYAESLTPAEVESEGDVYCFRYRQDVTSVEVRQMI
jgi:putative alpha-1,2-mannosidase